MTCNEYAGLCIRPAGKKNMVITTIINKSFATDTSSHYFSSIGIETILKEFVIGRFV